MTSYNIRNGDGHMNIVELTKAMEEGQTAYSQELKQKVIRKDYGLYYYEGDNLPNDTLVDCNMNIILTDDWEIEVEWADFWTAWQAAKEGWVIKSEHREIPTVINNSYATLHYFEIDGRWQILR